MRLLKVVLAATFLSIFLVACQGSSDQPLQANAGQDFSVKLGESPTFDGCASTGNITNYKWTIIVPGEQMPEDAGKILQDNSTNCSFTIEAPMDESELGFWIIELEVTDEAGNTSTDEVRVDVVP